MTQLPVSVLVSDGEQDGADPTPANNAASDTDTLDAAPAYAISIDAPPVVRPGDAVVIMTTPQNLGDQTGTNIVITQTYDPAVLVDVVVSDGGVVDPVGGLITWTFPTLDGRSDRTLTVTGRVPDSVGPGKVELPSTATVTDDGQNGPKSTASDSVAPPLVAQPDYVLDIEMPPTAQPGRPFEVLVTISNDGDQDGTNVTIGGTIPPVGISFVNVVATPPGTTASLDPQTGLITASTPLLRSGDAITLLVTVIPDAPLRPDAEKVAGSFVVMDDNANGDDPTPENNRDDESTDLVAVPDYVVTIESELEIAKPRKPIDYQIVVTNDGTQNGSGVVVTNTFPPEILTQVTASDGGIVDEVTGQITWLIGDLAIGESRTLTVESIVAGRTPRGLEEFAHVTTVTDDGLSGADPTPENNTDTEVDGIPSYGGFTYDGLKNESRPDWAQGGFGGGSGLAAGASSSGPGLLSEPGGNQEQSTRPRGGVFPARPPLRVKVMPPPVSPVYSGHAEPGTTVRATIYDAEGRIIGDRAVVADTGGNWLMTFPGAVIYEQPHRMDVDQTPALHNATADAGYNLRRFFQPVIHSTIFFAKDPSVGQVLRNSAYSTVEAMHRAAEGTIGFGWKAHAYEMVTASSNASDA